MCHHRAASCVIPRPTTSGSSRPAIAGRSSLEPALTASEMCAPGNFARSAAILAVRRGNADQAIALMRESLTRIRELHDKFAFVYALVPLVAAAELKGDDAWVARILGARDAVTERTGVTVSDKSVQDLRERPEREARARLGPDSWAAAYAAGRTSSIDALLKDIDGISRRAPRPAGTRRSDSPTQS